jgi:hypothetical protein
MSPSLRRQVTTMMTNLTFEYFMLDGCVHVRSARILPIIIMFFPLSRRLDACSFFTRAQKWEIIASYSAFTRKKTASTTKR